MTGSYKVVGGGGYVVFWGESGGILCYFLRF